MNLFRYYGGTSRTESSRNLIDFKLSEKQAECFLDDAEEYRSIHHRIDKNDLKLYNFLHSNIWTYPLLISIVGLHCLAFLEFPSSISTTSNVNINGTIERIEIPLALTLFLEAIFLIFILLDAIFQSYLIGKKMSLKNPWLISLFILMFVSLIDFLVSAILGKLYYFRLRRFFRPIFAIQKSQLMKKVLKSLSKTIVDILSAFLLLGLWLIAFTLIAVSIFNGFEPQNYDEQYGTFYDAFFTLLVLLTTANNPDAMVGIFNKNRFGFIFFVIFMVVGIFVFMNVLIAIVFNEFRNHVLDSMQTSLIRRRVATRALYEVLRGNPSRLEATYEDNVEVETLRRVINNSSICYWRQREMNKVLDSLASEVADWNEVKTILKGLDDHKESKMIFDVPKYKNERIKKLQKILLSRSFEIVGLLICLANIVVIGIDVTQKFDKYGNAATSLDVFNWIFIFLYILEQTLKYFCMGYNIYFSRQGSLIDFFVTLIILIMKIVETILLIYWRREDYIIGNISLWDLPRITNLLILVRAAKIVLLFPSLTPIINTLFDIPSRMKSVIGLMSLIFYLYALLGMNTFGEKINYEFMKSSNKCGTYQQLDYGGINFNDFYSSVVVLWCLLIVNNWQVFMIAFEQAIGGNKWAHAYMISWWIIAVIVVLNCVTAFVIEAYTQRKHYYEEEIKKRMRPQSVSEVIGDSIHYLRSSIFVNNSFTFQMLFQQDLIEPSDEDLLSAMKACDFLCEQYPHIAHSYYQS